MFLKKNMSNKNGLVVFTLINSINMKKPYLMRLNV